MPSDKNHLFHLPQIRRYTQSIQRKYQMGSREKNALSRFQDQLKSKQRKQYKKKAIRLKTLNVNDQETSDQFRRQLRSLKEQISFKVNECNQRLSSKLDDFILMSALKKDQSQILYQPFPIYLPPMYPQQPITQPHYDYDDQDYPKKRSSYPVKRSKKKQSRVFNKYNLRNFRKVALAALFIVRLRKFSEKIINFKKQTFGKYLNQSNGFKEQVTLIQKIFIEGLRPLLIFLLQNEDSQLKLNDGDSQNFKKEKILLTKKYFELLIEGLQKIINQESFDHIIKSVYYFCRHGSYACLEKLLTLEELQNISVSQKHFYLQAEKNLEKSQIINFLFMKILIYNGLGQSWKIDSQKFSQEKQTLQENILLISSILYQLLMDIQDDFIVNTPVFYPINNFQNIKNAKIYPAQSLTVKPGQFRKNEVISGLINQIIIKNIYKLEKTWIKQKNQLIQIIQKIHKKVVTYHKKLIQSFF